MSKIAVLGLGAMGSRMAANLLKAGYDVVVWNLTPAKMHPVVALGARSATSPKEAATESDVVISMVSDDDASRSVWLDAELGALSGMRTGALAIESSTVTGDWVRELGRLAAKQGIGFIDACVSGSRPQVEASQLVYFVGGRESDVAFARPVLQAAGGASIHHVGEVGAGAAVKLITNVLLGVQAVAMAESLSLLKREGVDPMVAIDAIATTFVCSTFAKGIGTLMATDAFTPMFTTRLVEKDMRCALAAGRGATLPLISATRHVFHEAMEHGWAEENLSSVVKVYREPATPASRAAS